MNALSLNPRDPELIDNFKLTQEKLQNKQAIEIPKVTSGERLSLTVLLFILITFLMRSRRKLKLKLVCYILLFGLYSYLDVNYLDLSYGKVGISLDSVDLRSGPDKKSITLFTSEEGTVFKVLKKSGTKVLVEDFDNNKGWVSKEDIFIKPNT